MAIKLAGCNTDANIDIFNFRIMNVMILYNFLEKCNDQCLNSRLGKMGQLGYHMRDLTMAELVWNLVLVETAVIELEMGVNIDGRVRVILFTLACQHMDRDQEWRSE